MHFAGLICNLFTLHKLRSVRSSNYNYFQDLLLNYLELGTYQQNDGLVRGSIFEIIYKEKRAQNGSLRNAYTNSCRGRCVIIIGKITFR